MSKSKDGSSKAGALAFLRSLNSAKVYHIDRYHAAQIGRSIDELRIHRENIEKIWKIEHGCLGVLE